MRIPLVYPFTFVAIVSLANASGHHKAGHHKHHGQPKGKVFDHFLQIWFENEVGLVFSQKTHKKQ
jgi:hypothetical protein